MISRLGRAGWLQEAVVPGCGAKSPGVVGDNLCGIASLKRAFSPPPSPPRYLKCKLRATCGQHLPINIHVGGLQYCACLLHVAVFDGGEECCEQTCHINKVVHDGQDPSLNNFVITGYSTCSRTGINCLLRRERLTTGRSFCSCLQPRNNFIIIMRKHGHEEKRKREKWNYHVNVRCPLHGVHAAAGLISPVSWTASFDCYCCWRGRNDRRAGAPRPIPSHLHWRALPTLFTGNKRNMKKRTKKKQNKWVQKLSIKISK